MKQITLEYCGMSATGCTVKEAKADAARKLSALVKDCYSDPSTAWLGDTCVIVVRGVHGWTYAHLRANDRDRRLCWTSGFETAKEALRSGLRHAADNGWSPDCADDSAYVAGLPICDADKRQIADQIAWQRRYQAARAQGANDHDAHAIACGMVLA